MRFIELAFVVSVAVVGSVMYYYFGNNIFLVLTNLTLFAFYLLALTGKSPHSVYPKHGYRDTWEYKLSIAGATIYFAVCAIGIMLPKHIQLLVRIGYGLMFATIAIVLYVSFYKRIYADFPIDGFGRNLVVCLRCLLVCGANYIYLIPNLGYSSEFLKTEDGMEYKLVEDGYDTHETIFVDSLSCYVTISHYAYADSVILIKYHTPDNNKEIVQTDTLPATGYEVGHIQSYLTSQTNR